MIECLCRLDSQNVLCLFINIVVRYRDVMRLERYSFLGEEVRNNFVEANIISHNGIAAWHRTSLKQHGLAWEGA